MRDEGDMNVSHSMDGGDHGGLPGSILAVLIALLLLLAGVVWVAFCIAIHRAAVRVAEMKRQRRRQQIITSALNRAIEQSRSPTPGLPPSLVQSPAGSMVSAYPPVQLSANDLPSYEEALRSPPQDAFPKHIRSQPCRSHMTNDRVHPNRNHLRIAPNRPSTSALTRVQDELSPNPPSYDVAIHGYTTH